MEEKKKKTTAAQIKATEKYQKKAYFKTLVRFPIEKEKDIRTAAGESLNGFIVKCVLDQVEGKEESKTENKSLQAVIDQLQNLDKKKLALVSDFIRIIEKQ